MAEGRLICVGMVRRPHGLRGSLNIELFGGDPARLPAGTVLTARGKSLTVTRLDQGPRGSWILVSTELTSIEQAETWRGADLFVDLPCFRGGVDTSWFVDELIGLSVCTKAGEHLGVVVDVEPHRGADLLVVRAQDGDRRAGSSRTRRAAARTVSGGKVVTDGTGGPGDSSVDSDATLGKGKEALALSHYPMVDEFVEMVDLAAGTITVKPWSYL